MATVESSDMVVVAEFGVPLVCTWSVAFASPRDGASYGASPGVPGSSDGGGGRLISVGALVVIVGASTAETLATCVLRGGCERES
jgi:hypothetical protein